MNSIITIGRQFGSGGREIGEKIAQKYGIGFYDKDLLKRAARESGMCTELFENNDEKPTSSFLYNLITDTYSFGYASPYMEIPISHKIFLAQFDTIKKIAAEGPCVIVGRCADYALSERDDCINLFIYAPISDRIERIADQNPEETDMSAIKDMIIKADKSRSSYYNYYSNKKWGRADSYDLCINSSMLGLEGTVDYLCNFIDRYNKK